MLIIYFKLQTLVNINENNILIKYNYMYINYIKS